MVKKLKSIPLEHKNKKTGVIKTTQYVPVPVRVKEFRENELYKGWSTKTTFLELNERVAIAKVEIFDDKDRLRADGVAFEDRDNPRSMVNAESYIENAQTGAMGRALGFLGIGIDEAIASFEEVVNATQDYGKGSSFDGNVEKAAAFNSELKAIKLTDKQLNYGMQVWKQAIDVLGLTDSLEIYLVRDFSKSKLADLTKDEASRFIGELSDKILLKQREANGTL